MAPRIARRLTASYLRSFIFGVEDSLVSTVGLLSGITIGGAPRETIFLTGIVLIFVEAFSMAAGDFLAERSAEEYVARRETALRLPLISGSIMFISYFLTGFIPLAPYLVLPIAAAFPLSIVLSLTSLFVLGVIGARWSGISLVKSGLRMAIIGGVAIAIGIGAGTAVEHLGAFAIR